MSYFTKQPTKRVVLPSNKALWADVFTTFTWKQEKKIGEAIIAGAANADAILNNVIADWNLTDDSGVAPIDSEHIDLLNREDAIAIIKAVNGLSVIDEDKDAKKTSSNVSPKL